MSISTVATPLLASPFASALCPVVGDALPVLLKIGERIIAFCQGAVTPAATCAFEKDLEGLLREVGRLILSWVYNHLEPAEPAAAPELAGWQGEAYRRRQRCRRRHGVGTLFGIIPLYRLGYEPLDTEAGLPSIFPLEHRLGLTAGRATPALTERVGQWSAQDTQQVVLDRLRAAHGVSWSAATLRKVTATFSAGLAPLRHAAQVALVLTWLDRAQHSRGPHKPVLSSGRDGVFVPLRGHAEYREASTATLTVLDRRGQRLGTVYLGHMPESGQATLTGDLTSLLTDVLWHWQGPLPRLEYVTDGGHHPAAYFDEVLQGMVHPRTGVVLPWQQVLDYYHACGYVRKLAEALFGAGSFAAAAWAHKMRRWLKDKRHGLFRVLHSAAALQARYDLSPADAGAYDSAYNYLRQRLPITDYAGYRRQGLAIGSGVTEAACKTLFTQRFKQSGMTWSWEGGQVIVDLRVLWLSGVWPAVCAAYWHSLPLPKMGTKGQFLELTLPMAA